MAERKNGLAPLPAGLLRPTMPTPPEDDEPTDPAEAGEPAAEGRGPTPEPRSAAARPRRRRTLSVAAPTKGRKLHLTDDVADRLYLLAHQRRTTASAIATEILDRHLPRFKLEREG